MNLKNSQQEVDNWIKEHGVRYFNELTNMAQLTEEVGEVARIIARRYGEQSEKESDKNKENYTRFYFMHKKYYFLCTLFMYIKIYFIVHVLLYLCFGDLRNSAKKEEFTMWIPFLILCVSM